MKVELLKTQKGSGKVYISGSKNSCLPILAISLLTNKKMILHNVPNISDVNDMLEMLSYIGVKIKKEKNKVMLKRKKVKNELLLTQVSKIRGSYYLFPGLIHNNEKVKVIYPGGCSFTNRPIDYHFNMFKKTNVIIEEHENIIVFYKNKLKNITIKFNKPTIGATINTILHSVLIKGTTKILNQPIEPEIYEVVNCLRLMGADIYINKEEIIIKGGKKLGGVEYYICPDRIEAGSYILLSSVLEKDVTIYNVNKKTIEYLEPYLLKMNIKYIYNKSNIKVIGSKKIKGINLNVDYYPSFPTDLQPIVTSVLTQAQTQSVIVDNIYEDRVSHIYELSKLNAKITYENKQIIINPSTLISGEVYAKDLRCGFALIVAGAVTKHCFINNFEVLDRGYERIIEKLYNIGIQINIIN